MASKQHIRKRLGETPLLQTVIKRLRFREVQEQSQRQIGRGRPSEKTQYETLIATIYTRSWRRNQPALKQEKNTDGLFPILCTDESIGN